jgi:hypothetical protein
VFLENLDLDLDLDFDLDLDHSFQGKRFQLSRLGSCWRLSRVQVHVKVQVEVQVQVLAGDFSYLSTIRN